MAVQLRLDQSCCQGGLRELRRNQAPIDKVNILRGLPIK